MSERKSQACEPPAANAAIEEEALARLKRESSKLGMVFLKLFGKAPETAIACIRSMEFLG
jgi:hypothetical protein